MYEAPSLRLALGLGDQELEQRLRPALDASEEMVVVAQCLAADQLLQAIESHHVDALVVAWSLHRLTDAILDQLERPGLPVILLVPDPEAARWHARRGPVLSVDATPATVQRAVLGARRGERPTLRPRAATEPLVLKPADRPVQAAAVVIAVTGGAGSPGRTTVASNLALVLGAAAPTVLLEADLCAPALAAYLDLDPSRNLCTLAHTVRDDPRAWGAALAAELQPLTHAASSPVVLCGPPKREMRSSIAPQFMERLVLELASRYEYVVVDVGAELLGADGAAASHRAALTGAHHLLLVCACDLVGLWHARTALNQLERQLGIDRQHVNLVLNRHDPRFHHPRAEVEWHMGLAVTGVIPFDHAAVEHAIAEQRALVTDSSSRAGRALVALAQRLSSGEVRPAAADAPQRGALARWWRRVLPRPHRVAPVRRPPVAERASLTAARHEPGGGMAW